MDDDTLIIMDRQQSTRRNLNRFWLSRKGRDLGNSADLDKIVKAWMWSNEGYGKRGLIVVDTAIGYTWGSFPGNEAGLAAMKKELKGHKIWSTYEDGEDLHVLVWGNVKDDGRQRYAPAKSTGRTRTSKKKGKLFGRRR